VWHQCCRSEHPDLGARKTSECKNGINEELIEFLVGLDPHSVSALKCVMLMGQLDKSIMIRA